MITINVGQIALWGLAVVGALALIPLVIRAVAALVAGVIFMIRGDG